MTNDPQEAPMLSKIKENLVPALIVAVLAGGTVVTIGKFFQSDALAEVTMPDTLTTAAAQGQEVFRANCAACHGDTGQGNAEGDFRGPPLIHDIYNPGHHGDEAFFRAARNGVQQHHWPFGNMPPQPQVSAEDVRAIITFVREVQRANGIKYRAHMM
jgi:cytochrome c